MDERRRLLERLEHPVRGLVPELVHPFDHEHSPGGLEWRPAGRRHYWLGNVTDQDLVGAAGDHPGQVGVSAGEDSGPGAVRIARSLGQQLRGQLPSHASLVSPPGPVE